MDHKVGVHYSRVEISMQFLVMGNNKRMTFGRKEMAIDVVTYTTAICACGPDWLLALDVFEDMVVDGVQPNLQAYTSVMCCCLAGEEYREAIHVFNRMKKAGITPDLRAYKLAIIALEKNGDVSGRWAMEAEIANSNIERYERDWDARW